MKTCASLYTKQGRLEFDCSNVPKEIISGNRMPFCFITFGSVVGYTLYIVPEQVMPSLGSGFLRLYKIFSMGMELKHDTSDCLGIIWQK